MRTPRKLGGSRGRTTTERGLGSEWIKLTHQARKIYAPVCHLCHLPIDLTLAPTDPESWTLDHLIPRAVQGVAVPPIDGVRPAHRSCNSRKGARETKPHRFQEL